MATPINGSIVNGFEVLLLFSNGNREIDAAQVSRTLGLKAATAHRLLITLEHVGALRRLRKGLYVLGPELERLGELAARHNPIARLVEPDLRSISNSLNESVMACHLSAHGPTCIAVASSNQTISVNIETGTLLPIAHSAQGKLWLANMEAEDREKFLSATVISRSAPIDRQKLAKDLQQIRSQGYAVNLGENEPDIAAVSVPVFSAAGKMSLSISVFGMLSRFDQVLIERARTELCEVAEKISEKL